MKRYTTLLSCLLGGLIATTAPAQDLLICPNANELHRDSRHHWWTTKASHDVLSSNPHVMTKYKWYSSTPSLAKKMDHFVGAQYSGIAEGHIICLYMPQATSAHSQSFPVIVHFEGLVLKPKDGEWQPDPKRPGIENCVSPDPAQCPYLPYQPDKIKDPYEELRKLA